MSEETTRDMNTRSFEARVLAEFAALRQEVGAVSARLTTLEDKVDARLRETRPIWEAMQADLRDVKGTVTTFKAQLGEIARDLFEMRGRIAVLEDRDRRPIA